MFRAIGRLANLVMRAAVIAVFLVAIGAYAARNAPPADRAATEQRRQELEERQRKAAEDRRIAEEEAASPAGQARAAWEVRARATTRERKLATSEAAREKEEVAMYAADPDEVVQGNYPWPVGGFTRREHIIANALRDAGMIVSYEFDHVFGRKDGSTPTREEQEQYESRRAACQKAVRDRIGLSEEEAEAIMGRVVRGYGFAILPDTPRGLTLEQILARFDNR